MHSSIYFSVKLTFIVVLILVSFIQIINCKPTISVDGRIDELDVDLDDILTNLSIETSDQLRRRRTIGSFDILSGVGSLFSAFLFNQFLGGIGGLFNGLIRGGGGGGGGLF